MINKNLKRIIALIILIVMFFPYIASFAAITQEEAGLAIATYAYNLCKNYGYDSSNNQTVYDHDNGGTQDRRYGYSMTLHSGTAECEAGTKPYQNKYPMDCVGVISVVIRQSLGLQKDADFFFFITPQHDDQGYFEPVTNGDVKPGDIYRSQGKMHVMIYLGDVGQGYTMAEGWATYPEMRGAVLTNSSSDGYTPYRIREDKLADIEISDVVTDPATGAGLSPITSIFDHVNMSEFYYNGIPDGKYSVTSGKLLDWIINTLKEIFNFIINLVTYIVRMVFVGWTFLVENMLTSAIKMITGEEEVVINATDYGEDGNKFTDDNITIEKIIFDNVKVFDVNFFNIETEE